jgi:hypothetical protein
MEDNSFTILVNHPENLAEIKTRYNVPPELQSCHTAIVDGYVIEGHVPVAEIERLLTERPDVIGIAVAGMPPGSPGMPAGASGAEPYNVIAFDQAGNLEVYASYP